LFHVDLDLIGRDIHVFGDNGDDLILHLLQFLWGQVAAIRDQHQLQALLGSERATPVAAAQQAIKKAAHRFSLPATRRHPLNNRARRWKRLPELSSLSNGTSSPISRRAMFLND